MTDRLKEDPEAFDRIGDRINSFHDRFFVGRSFELNLFRQYATWLGDKTERIINLYGMGGMGKSYLLDQFRKAAEELHAEYILIDIRELDRGRESVCEHILRSSLPINEQTHAHDSKASLTEYCISVLNTAAASRRLVLAFDHYEEIGGIDQWLRESLLAKLHADVLIVIAGRYALEGPWKLSPAWRRMIVSLPVTELSYEDVQLYTNRHGIIEDQRIDSIWLQTLGHPLSLALAVPTDAAANHDPNGPPVTEPDDRLEVLIYQWFREAPDETLREAVEAASLPRCFNQETLSVVLGREVGTGLFERLIRLSFIRRTARGWQMHDLMRESTRQMFRSRTPGKFELYAQRLVQYNYQRIMNKKNLRHNGTWEISELLQYAGNPVLRAHFRYSRISSNYLERLDESNLAEAESYIIRRKQQAKEWKIRCSDPETGSMFRYALTEKQSTFILMGLEPSELLHLDARSIQLLRSPDGHLSGLAAIIPIHQGTLDYLMNHPFSKSYFNHLQPLELKKFKVPPDREAGWFIQAIDVENLENEELRSDIIHLRLDYILAGNLLITSPPPLDYYDTALRSLGFQEVPEVAHCEYDGITGTKTYLLDTKGDKLLTWLNNWISSPLPAGSDSSDYSDSGSARIPLLTPREQEVAELLVLGHTNAEMAAQLYVSEAAVKKHLNSMLQKFSVTNRTRLAKEIMDLRANQSSRK